MADPQRQFICLTCFTVYVVACKSEPADREPRCEECDAALPDQDGDEWLHYQRRSVIVASF